MDTQVLTTLISGIFSLLTALGSVWLKARLERNAVTKPRTGVAGEVAEAPPEPQTRSAPTQTPEWSWKRPVVVFLGAFSFGLVTRALRPLFAGPTHWEMIVAFVALVAASLGFAWDHRRERRGFWPYELEVLALWLAFSSGWSVVQGGVWSDLVVVTVGWWMACAVVGGLVVIIARKKTGS